MPTERPHLVDAATGTPLCPEAEYRDSLSDEDFWVYVLTGQRPDAMTRDLTNLITAGLAEKDEDGRYRLTARLPQQAVKVYAALGRAETRLAEVKAAVHRNSDY